MTDASQISIDSEVSIIKLRDALQQLTNRVGESSDSSLILSEATALFKNFFDTMADSEFRPKYLKTGDVVSSEIYNQNLISIYNDISRFYRELNNLTNANIKSFNYSQVVISEIKNRAAALSSIVLDLNILNNFTRGDVIVAGDDFTDLSKTNDAAPLSASKAEPIYGSSGLSLARSTTKRLSSDPNIKVEVIPLSPQTKKSDSAGQVNTSPTPGNFERFYEGNYYNFLGAARPEGGRFNIQFILDPNEVKPVQEGDNPSVPKGIFLEYGASEEEKAKYRQRMFDGSPDTFWECEYVIKQENPLVPDVTETIIQDDSKEGGDNAPSEAAIQIDVNELNNKALARDSIDLVIDIIVTLPENQNINFVTLNPVVFSSQAFIEVLDISTASTTDTEFKTVDGWERLRFPKAITPEANEFLTDSQLSATLAPARYSYTGQGVYPFPVRFANKVKIRVSMSNPSSQPYEKTYVLLVNTIDVETTITTTTKKGRLRF